MKKESFNLGVRMTEGDQIKLGQIQGFLRVNQLKVGDSAVARAMITIVNASEPLLQSVREAMKTRSDTVGGTSWSLKKEGSNRLESLRREVKKMGGNEFKDVSKNDVLRGIMNLLEPDIPFVGRVRELVSKERANRKN